jgi:hypothetical protein
MRSSIRRLIVSVVLLLSVTVTAVRADEPEKLPPPKEAQPTLSPPAYVESVYVYPIYLRPHRYEVWSYYGVDRQGRFRPRVAYTPYGSFYLYNGQPYPWTTTHARDFMPYVMD